jgi:uncharacterized protein (UPF0335 family)
MRNLSPRERLVKTVQELERLEEEKRGAAEALTAAFEQAKWHGLDPATLKVVLKLRKLTPLQREERRALEAVYLASLGMLEGEPLPEAARRRLDGHPPPATAQAAKPAAPDSSRDAASDGPDEPPAALPTAPPQPALPLKDPEEARREGAAAAGAGARIYDNPYPAGDPCRAAWDEGWCAAKKSNGMDLPSAYQRRTEPPAKKDDADDASKKGAA